MILNATHLKLSFIRVKHVMCGKYFFSENDKFKLFEKNLNRLFTRERAKQFLDKNKL